MAERQQSSNYLFLSKQDIVGYQTKSERAMGRVILQLDEKLLTF